MSSNNIQMTNFSIQKLLYTFRPQDLINKKKAIVFVGTIATTYACLYYFPPSISRWSAGMTILTGSTYLLSGMIKRIFQLCHYPNISNTANMWSGETSSPNQLHAGCKTSGTRPSMKQEKKIPQANQKPPTTSNQKQQAIVVQTSETMATISPGSYHSGKRPTKKGEKL